MWRETYLFRPPVLASGNFQHPQSHEFRDHLRAGLLRYAHPLGQLGDGSLRLDQMLDEIAMAFPHSAHSCRCQPLQDKLVYTQAQKKREIAKIQLARKRFV